MRQRIPFVGPSHESRSANADTQRTLNCYIEMDSATPRAPVALYGTPGLELRGTIGNGPWRAALREKTTTYVVSGSEVYRVIFTLGFGYGASKIGDVGTSTGPIGIASNGDQILIVDGTGGWIVTTASNAFAAIADPDFPVGVTRATYQDGWFLVTGDGTNKFYMNEIANDGTAWNGLDFASAEGAPDLAIAILSLHREVLVFGDNSVEIYSNTGNADFPFERNGNAFIQYGLAAADSVAVLDNTAFWLGTDDRGGATVYRLNGYTPVPLSDPAIAKALQSYETYANARAFSYQQEGHSFYVINFPTADKTWVYDASTGQWHERCSLDIFYTEHMWRAACHVFWNFDHLVGDYQNGKFYRLNLDVLTDDGGAIKRLRRSQSMENVQNRMFYSSFHVDMETGTGSGTVEMRYSDDGGHTWKSTRSQTVTAGDYGTRVMWDRLGSGRNRVWEISTFSPIKWAIIGALANFEPGSV